MHAHRGNALVADRHEALLVALADHLEQLAGRRVVVRRQPGGPPGPGCSPRSASAAPQRQALELARSLLPAVNQFKSRDVFDQAMEHAIRAAIAGEEFDVEVRPVFAKGANMFDRSRASTDQTFAILSVGPRLDEDEARHEPLDELIKLRRKKTA